MKNNKHIIRNLTTSKKPKMEQSRHYPKLIFMKNLNFTRAIIFFLFIGTGFLSCKKSSTANNSDPNNNSTIFHDSNLKLVDINSGNVLSTGAGAYDIFGNGTMYINVGGGVSASIFSGSTSGNSSSVEGTGPAASYNTTYFNHIDPSLIVEILDTTITWKCNGSYPYAKFYPLTTYSQSTFVLPQASYSNFVDFCYLSQYIFDSNSNCGAYSFLNSPFANGGYLIFRVRNIKTSKCNYGWIRVMVSSGNNFVSPISFSEIAYSKTQDVLLAPGYYEK